MLKLFRSQASVASRLRVVLIGIVVTLLALVSVLCVVFFSNDDAAPEITRERCNKLSAGMTRSEVELRFGPPRDYRTGATSPTSFNTLVSRSADDPQSEDAYSLVWLTDNAFVMVFFDKKDRVAGVLYSDLTLIDQSALANWWWRLRRKLGILWLM